MNYENRITIFIDILGFRNIVKNTETNPKYAEKIFSVLDSMKSEEVAKEMFGEASNVEESEEEKKRVRDFMAEISERLLGKSSIQITHFSDSIVMSINIQDNDTNGMSLIEYVCRLQYRLWRDFKVLIRGGVSVDKLIHIEGGPLFGPAMVRAYDFETNLAIYPRIVLDERCLQIIKHSPSFEGIKNMFKDFNGSVENNGKKVEIKDGLEMNLATSFYHLLTSHFTFRDSKRIEVLRELSQSIPYLEKLKTETNSNQVREKYDYLIAEIQAIKLPPYLDTRF